ncbi:MAG: hypothetical protein ACJ8OJ_09455 [Povalibacter sp.]
MKARRCSLRTIKRISAGLGAGALYALSFGVSAQDALSDLDDAAARMQYAYYTADSRALEEALSLIAAMEASPVPGLKEYFSAYGEWKLAQLYAEAQASGKNVNPGKAAQECVRQAKAAIAANARMAEAHAIQAICAGSKPSGGDCSAKPLRNALELEPQNPRVRLIELLCVGSKELPTANSLQRARALVAAFESAPPSRPGKPDWGQAEALVLLGQIYLERGDSVAARDSIERALVVAPDYRRAQQLLQTVSTHSK